jgi:hypothetical protein
MTREIGKDQFDKSLEQAHKNIVLELDEYYSVPETWEDDFEDDLELSIFWERVLNVWLKGVLLYSYPEEPFASNLFAGDFPLIWRENNEFSGWTCRNLKGYFVARATLAYILNRSSDFSEYLLQSRKYHLEHLRKSDYDNENDAVAEADADTAVYNFVPQLVVTTFLEIDYDHVISEIRVNEASQDNIWVITLNLIEALKDKNHDVLKKCWIELLNEWRYNFCHAQASFQTYNLVLIYILYCRATDIEFSMESLSSELLKV